MDVVTEYLLLGLRFDRVVDGFVDAYIGDPALREQVANEPSPKPSELSRRAQELAAQVPDSDLSDRRQAFLTAHLDALALAGRRLAGEEMSFTDEVAGYFQVRIEQVDTDVYAQAHDEISGLLGGSGPLADRFAEMRDAELCPAGPRRARGPHRRRGAPHDDRRTHRPRGPARDDRRSRSSKTRPGAASTTTSATSPPASP